LKLLRREEGFTLLEVLAAITIFSVVILMFSSFFVHGFQTAKSEDKQLVAMNLAQQIVEDLKNAKGEWVNPPQNSDLTYDELFTLMNQNVNEIQLKSVPINDRNYEPKLSLSSLDTGLADHPLIILTVSIYTNSSTVPLATVHGGMVE
jgi:prepilin-type N-terminal cleavage/methylation domain-containing protein